MAGAGNLWMIDGEPKHFKTDGKTKPWGRQNWAKEPVEESAAHRQSLAQTTNFLQTN